MGERPTLRSITTVPEVLPVTVEAIEAVEGVKLAAKESTRKIKDIVIIILSVDETLMLRIECRTVS